MRVEVVRFIFISFTAYIHVGILLKLRVWVLDKRVKINTLSKLQYYFWFLFRYKIFVNACE